MIVIGVDVHKHSLSAVAVDEVGRELAAAKHPAASNDNSPAPSPSIRPAA